MTAPNILGFIWGDLVNRRVALDVIAGVATFAIATAISALSIAFLSSTNEIIDVAMKPTQTSAGILRVVGGDRQFTVSEFARLRQEIDVLQRAGRIAAVSPVVDEIEHDVFQLLTRAKSRVRGTTRIWSVPHEAPLLRPEYGATYLVGGPFGGGAESNCGPRAGAPRHRPGGFRPRIGVILNKSFAARLYDLNDVQFADRVKQGLIDPGEIDVIDIAVRVGAGDSYGPRERVQVALCVSGIVDEPTYTDLIFTEDLARAYFLGGRRLPGRYLAHFDQLNGVPLMGRESAAAVTSGYYWPRTAEGFDYLGLRNAGREPYGQLILAVRDWTRAGEREDIRRTLLRSVPIGGVQGEDAARLVEWARIAASPPAAGRQPAVPQSEARRRLRRLLLDAIRPLAADFDLADSTMQISAVGDERAIEFMVRDRAARASLEISYDPARERASFRLGPPWTVEAPDQEDITAALLRLQSVIDTYGAVMFWVVLVLAASAALLLAFSHLLRKRRDIGLLLANGAGRSTVFSIYIGQITLIAVSGWTLGVGLSFVLAPALETAAAETLRRFMESSAEAGFFSSSNVLEVHGFVLFQAFTWVVPPALLGALYPVFDATRVDPLSSMGQGRG